MRWMARDHSMWASASRRRRAVVVVALVVSVAGFALLAMAVARTALSWRSPCERGREEISATVLLPSGLFCTTVTQPQQIDVVVTLPDYALGAASRESGTAEYLPICLTGLFTLLGSGIILAYNQVTGKSARKFDWSKHLWDKYQHHYLELRNALRDTTDAKVIENKVRVLSAEMILPTRLERELTDLVAFLQTDNSDERKLEKARAFLTGFEDFIARPWDHF